jgi:biopolymer transport protein ExbD
MKFPRNARIFRGQLDAAPFAAVFFLLVLLLMLSTRVYTPGVSLTLPQADRLPGTDKPTVSVAIDAAGRLYFENQSIAESSLAKRLKSAVAETPEPLTLIVQADRAVNMDMLIRLTLLARSAGITNSLLATLPRSLAAVPVYSTP